MKTRSLGSGYELPFGVVVPPKPGFLRNGGADLYLEIADYDKHCLYRLNQVMFIFRALACSGALSGRAIAPTQSTLELGSCTRSGERQLHVPIHRSAIDDRALLVLANLLLAARRRLSVTGVRLDLADVPGSISVVRTPSGETTYPGRFEPLPFMIDDEEPETDAITFDVEFVSAPETEGIKALNGSFDQWSRAILKGAYALAPFAPGDSHVESYDDDFVVIGNRAERAFHKLRTDSAAIDGAINMLAAFHGRGHTIASVRLA